jgi:hypothetical protein
MVGGGGEASGDTKSGEMKIMKSYLPVELVNLSREEQAGGGGKEGKEGKKGKEGKEGKEEESAAAFVVDLLDLRLQFEQPKKQSTAGGRSRGGTQSGGSNGSNAGGATEKVALVDSKRSHTVSIVLGQFRMSNAGRRRRRRSWSSSRSRSSSSSSSSTSTPTSTTTNEHCRSKAGDS